MNKIFFSAKNKEKLFFQEKNMEKNAEKTELTQKYCPHLSDNVTLLSDEKGISCLSSHLCHDERRLKCDHYSGSDFLNEKPPEYK